MKDQRKKEKKDYKSPPKKAFTAEQLAAVIEKEVSDGVYDGRYDDKPVEVKGDVKTDAVSEPKSKRGK